MVGEVEPSQRRDFQPFCRAAMPTVPAAVEAIGLLPTFGDNTGIDDQGLCMCRGDHVEDRRLVEGDKVNVSGVPTGKGGSTLCSSRMVVLPSRLSRITQPENRRTRATTYESKLSAVLIHSDR